MNRFTSFASRGALAAACIFGFWMSSGCGKSTKGPGVAAVTGDAGAAGEKLGLGASGQVGGQDVGHGGGQGGSSTGCAVASCDSSVSDSCCSAVCDGATDVDCRVAAGSACAVDSDCETSLCVDGYCCAAACEVCQECTGPGGSCAFLPARSGDVTDADACSGENWCDGRGGCEPKAQVAAGSHTCALLADGNVRCWGRAHLGYGHTMTIGDDEIPAVAGNVDVGASVVQVSVGSGHTCAVLATGNVRCWGYNELGQLAVPGTENIGDDEVPASSTDVALGSPAIQVVTGRGHSCALLAGGSVSCWGYGIYGQLGYPGTFWGSPPGLADVGEPVVQLAAGWFHTCALLAAGNVRCWGYNGGGQLGYPGHSSDVGDDESPASLGNVPLDAKVVQLALNVSTTCALLVDGEVRCWGGQHEGTDGLTRNLPIGGKVKQLAVGGPHTCALLTDGNVRCWGAGAKGQLGYGNADDIRSDQLPPPLGNVEVGGKVVELAAGTEHTCALLEDGNIRCWGLNDDGQLGYGHTENIGDDETPASAGDVPYR